MKQWTLLTYILFLCIRTRPEMYFHMNCAFMQRVYCWVCMGLYAIKPWKTRRPCWWRGTNYRGMRCYRNPTWPPWLHMQELPSVTLYSKGFGLKNKQWAAVTTHWGLISVPPQNEPTLPSINLSSRTCQGHKWRTASVPLTTRLIRHRPHSIERSRTIILMQTF